MFIAVFFLDTFKIVIAITRERVCCLNREKIMKNGKCINDTWGDGTIGK
ncbi:MAG: hypothetical protein ACR5KW_03600 [Wolbachia sp.]